eukprot:gene26806-4400_t
MSHQFADRETALIEVGDRASPNVWNRDPEGMLVLLVSFTVLAVVLEAHLVPTLVMAY